MGLEKQIDTIATKRFLKALRGIGKTKGLIENIKNYIDDTLLYKKEFEVLVVVENVEMKKLIRLRLTDYYMKYINLITMQEVMYKLSEFPIMDGREDDVPNILNFKFGNSDKTYEHCFVDPSCYEILCQRQLDKLKKVEDILFE